jgi:hypothetical protein
MLNDLWAVEAPTHIGWPPQAAVGLFIEVYDWDTLIVYPDVINVLPQQILLCSGFFPCAVELNGIDGRGVLERRANGSIACLSRYGCRSVSLASMHFICDSGPAAEPVLKVESTALGISRVSFAECSSKSDGGVARCYGTGATVNVESSLFRRTKSDGMGGAISAVGCSVTVTNTSFDSCYADDGGGAVSATQYQCYGSADEVGTQLVIKQCKFVGCGSESGGGAIFASSAASNVVVSLSDFSGCWSNASGGAIFATDQVQVQISNGKFEKNVASRFGGAVALLQLAKLAVFSSRFSGNLAVSAGGGATYASDAFLFLQDILAEGNHAPRGGGGAIYWDGEFQPSIVEKGKTVNGFKASLCGEGNLAIYGNCLASSFKWLDVENRFAMVFAGLQFLVVVVKRDAYNQTIFTDSASVLQAVAVLDEKYRPDPYVGLSGSFILSLESGQADFSMVVKPSFTFVDSANSVTAFKTEPAIYFKGLDSETGKPMHSSILPLSLQRGGVVCPPGFVLVVDEQRPGSNQTALQGGCSMCASGTYSVGPLYGLSAGEPSCLNCLASAKCKGGFDIQFSLGHWIISGGMYKLIACPAGHQLVNSVAGVFSHDVQNCLACGLNEYVLNSNNSNISCEKCPVGAMCDGKSLKSLVDGALWVGDVISGVYYLKSCPAGYEIQSATLDGQQCLLCPATFFCLGGDRPRAACPEGTYCLPGANASSACLTVVYVALVMTLPLTRDEFTTVQQNNFQQAIAAATGVDVGYVLISSVSTTNRRATGASIQVYFTFSMHQKHQTICIKNVFGSAPKLSCRLYQV